MSSKLLRHAVATVGRSTGVLSGKVIAALSGFGVFWIIARQYSVHTVGEYVFLQSLGNMVVMAANWGVNELIFIECSVHSEYSEYYLARSRLAKVLLGAVIGAIATLALAAFSSFSISIFLVILVTAMTDAQTISHLMILRAHEDNTADTIHLPARSLAKLGCCYLLFFAPMQLVEILALMFLSNLATLLLVARRCRQRLRTVVPKRPDQHHTIGKLLRSATPFALSGAVGTLSTQGRVAIVGMLGGSEMVAQYGVGMQFYQVINFLPSAINVTIQPRFARLYTTDRRLWRHDVTMSTMTAFAVAVCVGLGCFFVLPYVVSRFFGERYVSAMALFPYFSVAAFFNIVWVSTLAAAIVGAGQINRYVQILTTELLIGAGCAFLVIPTFGLAGSGLALVMSEIIVFVLLMVWLRKEVRGVRNGGTR